MGKTNPEATLKLGLNVDVVVSVNWTGETIDVRRATVYEMQGGRIVLSQTTPAIAKAAVGEQVGITYLRKEQNELKRYGIKAKIVKMISDYRITEQKTAPAFVVTQTSAAEQFNVRMFYRVELPGDCGISLQLKEEVADLMDISIGGAKFTHERRFALKPQKIIDLKLRVEDKSFDVRAKVVRITEIEGRAGRRLEVAAVQFLNLKPGGKEALARKIRVLEREMRE